MSGRHRAMLTLIWSTICVHLVNLSLVSLFIQVFLVVIFFLALHLLNAPLSCLTVCF